jgi:ABC-2 type transport system permease protein
MVVAHQLIVLGVGVVLFDATVEGSVVQLFFTLVPFATMVVAYAFSLVAICRSVRRFSAYNNLISLIFAGLAGCLAPVELLPDWARVIAPLTPAYWALQGIEAAFLGEPAQTSLRAGRGPAGLHVDLRRGGPFALQGFGP